MEDYLRFTMALANGGAFQGKRIIGKQDARVHDRRSRRQPARPPAGLRLRPRLRGAHRRRAISAIAGSVGEYGWAGNAGTTFWVDPREQLIAIYMVQASEGDTRFLRNQFRTMVQAATVD